MVEAIQMALQPPSVHHMMQESFSLFEEGELKVRDMTGALIKAMEGKLAPKHSHFIIFQGLQYTSKTLCVGSLYIMSCVG